MMSKEPIDLNVVDGKWLDGECINVLFDNDNIRIEHVFMLSRSSPPGFWYNVPEDEWVFVISGNISLQFSEFDSAGSTYYKGQSFFIPRFRKHRIILTSPDCIVLCVFVK